MITFLVILGAITAIAWSYAAIAIAAYVALFRRAHSGDRWFLSAIWPWSLPATLYYWIRSRRMARVEDL